MEYSSALEYPRQLDWDMAAFMAGPGPELILSYHEGAYHRFLSVLPEEPIQGLALACQNRINILSRQGSPAASALPYRKLTCDRPRQLAEHLYNALKEYDLLRFQRGQFVIRIIEDAFVDLAICKAAEKEKETERVTCTRN